MSVKFCPACGQSCAPGAKFCGSCGHRFSAQDDVVKKVTETVRSAESAVRTAESAVRTATSVRDLVIAPPAEWKVVVGDRLPGAVAEKAAGTIQAKASDAVVGKATEVLEKVVFTTVEKTEAGVLAPITSPEPAQSRCISCGAVVKPGAKFCGSCGTAVITSMKAVQDRGHCASCGAVVKPGAKFCGSCGAKVPVS